MAKLLQIIAVLTIFQVACLTTSHAAIFGTAGFEESEGYPGSGGGINGVVDPDIGTWSALGNVTNSAIFRDGAQSALGDGTLTLDGDAATKAAIQAATGDIRISFSMYWPEGADMRMNGFGGTNDTMTGELWQFRIKPDGDIHFQTDLLGNDTGAQNDIDTPATDPTNQWVDFIAEMNLSGTIGLFNSLQYRVGNDPFKESLSTVSQFRDRNEGTHINRLTFNNDNDGGEGNARYDNIVIADGSAPPPDTYDRTWNVNNSGNFQADGNWTGGLGGSPAHDNMIRDAVFGNAISLPRAVFTETGVSVNSIKFDHTVSYAVTGPGTINIVAGTNATLATPGFAVDQGSHEFQAVVNIHNTATANVANGSALTFNNSLNLNGQTLTKTGSGTLNVRNDLTLEGGMLSIQQGTIAGNGSIGGDVSNDGGTISPGNSLEASENNQVPEPSAWLLVVAAWLIMLCWRQQKT